MEKPMTDTKPAWAAAPRTRTSSTAPSNASNDRLSLSAAVKCPERCRVAPLPARAPFAAGDSNKSAARLAEKPGKTATRPRPQSAVQAGAKLEERRRKRKLDVVEFFRVVGARTKRLRYLCDCGLRDESARCAQAIHASAISNKTALSFAELFSARRRHSAAYWRYCSASSIRIPRNRLVVQNATMGTWNFWPKFRIKSVRRLEPNR